MSMTYVWLLIGFGVVFVPIISQKIKEIDQELMLLDQKEKDYQINYRALTSKKRKLFIRLFLIFLVIVIYMIFFISPKNSS